MKTQRKLKKQTETKAKRVFRPAAKKQAQNTQASSADATTSAGQQLRAPIWQASIEKLKTQKFADVEAAVCALVAEVTRVEGGALPGQEEFLQALFLTDANILEQLEKSLNVVSKQFS